MHTWSWTVQTFLVHNQVSTFSQMKLYSRYSQSPNIAESEQFSDWLPWVTEYAIATDGFSSSATGATSTRQAQP